MKAWYFSENPDHLSFDDKRRIKSGITHTVEDDPELRPYKLRGCTRPWDSLRYALGSYIWRIDLGGIITHDENQVVATECAHLWGYDATDVLKKFTRLCTLDVAHLWNAPNIAIRYLRNGDKSLLDSARNAAHNAAHKYNTENNTIARTAAWSVVQATAKVTAQVAARTTAIAALQAATEVIALKNAIFTPEWTTAWITAEDAQNRRLYRMLMEGRR
jgi:hypothetical protein